MSRLNGVAVQASVGSPEIVLPAYHHELMSFPDQPIAFLSNNPLRFLMVAGNSTVLMEGEPAVPVREVLSPGGTERFDNGYAGITSVYHDEVNDRLLGFYHAEDHVGMPRTADNPVIQGAYWSIGLAISSDNGINFEGGQQILRSSIVREDVTRDHQGIGDVCVIPDSTGDYLYAYYTDLTRRLDNDRAQIGMARSRISEGAEPGTWWKYHNGNFGQVGLGGDESGIVMAPNTFSSEVIQPHVMYLPEWKRYVMVCSVLSFDDKNNGRAEEGGIFFCHSSDGINWSDPMLLFVGLPFPLQGCEYVAHPTLYLNRITPESIEGWVLYCYSPYFGYIDPQQPHHLTRRSVTITRSVLFL